MILTRNTQDEGLIDETTGWKDICACIIKTIFICGTLEYKKILLLGMREDISNKHYSVCSPRAQEAITLD